MNHEVMESDNRVLKENAMKAGKWKPMIVLDFDGVIHRYRQGWQGGEIYDEPMPGIESVLQEWSERFKLVILTTRDPNVPGGVWDWLKKYELHRFFGPGDVTNKKPPAMVYVDDRGYRFEGKWTTRVMVEIERLAKE